MDAPDPASTTPSATVAASAVLCACFAMAYFVVRPAEDAVILYDYARNLAQAGVITFGQADFPIEGATDFLWMVTIAGFSALGIDEYVAALALSAVGAVVLVRLLGAHTGPWVAAAAILATPFAYSSGAGFSTLAFSAAFAFCLQQWLEGASRRFWLAVLFLCLLRPDGVVWALVPCAQMLLRALREKRWTTVRDATVYLVVPGVVYFVGRALYFGEWLPLPFLVKSSSPRDVGPFFGDSFVPVLSVALPALGVALASRHRETIARVAAVVAVPTLFYLGMKLEQNLGNRFIAPMFFGTALLLAVRSAHLSMAFMGLVALVSAATTVGTALHLADSRNERVFELSKELAAHRGGKMAVTEAGRLAYYSRWVTHDTWGLNTPRYAKRLITDGDLRRERYDLIVMHCDLDMLKTRHEGDASRSWHNQCVVLTEFVKAGGYDVYLAPFLRTERLSSRVKRMLGRPGEACPRYDIYAVRRDSPRRDHVAKILRRHAGVPYSPGMHTDGDRLCLDGP